MHLVRFTSFYLLNIMLTCFHSVLCTTIFKLHLAFYFVVKKNLLYSCEYSYKITLFLFQVYNTLLATFKCCTTFFLSCF